MKEAIITDLNGRYIEPTLVEDSLTGVFDILKPVEGDEEQTVLTGYTVAIRPPDGLYQPTFDVEGYRKAKQDSEQVDGTSFWRDGLTPEEIEALKTEPEPTQTDILVQQLIEKELDVAELKKQGEAVGAFLVAIELRIAELEDDDV